MMAQPHRETHFAAAAGAVRAVDFIGSPYHLNERALEFANKADSRASILRLMWKM